MKHLVLIISCMLAVVACSKQPADKTYSDTLESFDEFANTLVKAIKDDDREAFDAIVGQFAVPDAKAWFDKTFGAEAGARLFAEYEASPMRDWKRGWPDLRKMIVDQERGTVTTSRHDSPDDEMATGHQANALRAMQHPVALYRMQLTRADGSESFMLWSFVHVDGKFRFIGKTKRSKARAAGSGSVDNAVDMLGELPIKRAREFLREKRGK